jgi:hypothetical protein
LETNAIFSGEFDFEICLLVGDRDELQNAHPQKEVFFSFLEASGSGDDDDFTGVLAASKVL